MSAIVDRLRARASLLPRLLAACAAIGSLPAAASPGEPLLSFAADGNLACVDADGSRKDAPVIRGDPAGVRYIEKAIAGRRGQGVYLEGDATLALPVSRFNPGEGTLSFWFRPDWSVPDYTEHVLFEIQAGPAYQMVFRKGWNAPDYCHLLIGAPGNDVCHFPSHNLFTGRTWRHYAVRWSAQRGHAQFVVDGDTGGSRPLRTGEFKTDAQGPLSAQVLLGGAVRGAFAEVKVFDRWLETDELMAAAGLAHVAGYLQEQRPPPGFPADASGALSLVEPATGRATGAIVPAEGADARGNRPAGAYDPDRVENLPATAHTPWARPLAGGGLRVLFVMPASAYDGFTSLVREGVELWQRLEMTCKITNRPDPAVMGEDFDVIVVSHQGMVNAQWNGWSDLDGKLRAWILERVTSGRSGLVLACPTKLDDAIAAVFDPRRRVSPETVLRGFPTAAMPRALLSHYERIYGLDDSFFETDEDLAQQVVDVYRGGSVRAVKLNYAMLTPWGLQTGLTPDTAYNAAATLTHYDYWMALAARAVLFAADRQPAARITGAAVTGDAWTVSIEGLDQPATLWYRGRDMWGREYAGGERKLRRAGNVAIAGTPLPPRAAVDFILRDRQGRVLDWFSAAVPPARQARIAGIDLDKPLYGKGDTVRARVDVDGVTNGGYRVVVYLGDHEGRRLIRQEAALPPAEAGRAQADIALAIPESSDSLLMRVDALLYQGAALADERSADCPVPLRRFRGFMAAMYGGGNNRALVALTKKRFRDDFGMNTMVHQGELRSALRLHARDNLHSIEYISNFGCFEKPEDDMTSSENWEQFFPKNLLGNPEDVMPFRPVFYSLGEEQRAPMRSSQSPTATARFRSHLQSKYGTLERLNAVWGTPYAAWDDVTMLTPEVVDMLKIRFDVPEFENRRFMERVFAERHGYLAEYLRKIDSCAEVGIHSGWDLWMGYGYDYWLLSRGMEAMMGYAGPQLQYIRSFFRHAYGGWYHYAVGSHGDVRWHPWEMLASGARGFGVYTIDPEFYSTVAADLHLSSDWAAGGPEFRDAAAAGDLLSQTEYEQDQVAIHYSQDSFQRAVGGAISWIHLSFINLLFDAGVPFKFVSYQQVAEGELTKQRFPLLILPHSLSLSEAEAKAIREYVQDGGTVWADVLPGTYDNCGQLLGQSQLTDLFADLTQVDLPGGKRLQAGTVGKGKVILGDIGNYSYARNIGDYLPTQAMLDRAVELACVRRVARAVNRGDRQLANGIWTAGYRKGNQRYLVLVKDYALADASTADVVVELDRPGFAYELRSGSYLGRTDRIQSRLEPARGKVFSILPYRVRGIALRAPSKPARGSDLVLAASLVTEGEVGQDDLHLLRVSVADPSGEEVTALRRLVPIRGGVGEIRLPLAHNDPPGRWSIHCTDTATGLGARTGYELPRF